MIDTSVAFSMIATDSSEYPSVGSSELSSKLGVVNEDGDLPIFNVLAWDKWPLDKDRVYLMVAYLPKSTFDMAGDWAIDDDGWLVIDSSSQAIGVKILKHIKGAFNLILAQCTDNRLEDTYRVVPQSDIDGCLALYDAYVDEHSDFIDSLVRGPAVAPEDAHLNLLRSIQGSISYMDDDLRDAKLACQGANEKLTALDDISSDLQSIKLSLQPSAAANEQASEPSFFDKVKAALPAGLVILLGTFIGTIAARRLSRD